MLPAIQKQVSRLYINTIDDLLELGCEVENVLEAERLYVPPPPQQTILPESAYKTKAL